MNRCGQELVPMSDFILVRERPNGAVLRARQVAGVMKGPGGCWVYIGDWVVEPSDSDEQGKDLFVVRQDEFIRAWDVVEGAVAC